MIAEVSSEAALLVGEDDATRALNGNLAAAYQIEFDCSGGGEF